MCSPWTTIVHDTGHPAFGVGRLAESEDNRPMKRSAPSGEKREDLQLVDGSKVAVIGGGPAGSLRQLLPPRDGREERPRARCGDLRAARLLMCGAKGLQHVWRHHLRDAGPEPGRGGNQHPLDDRPARDRVVHAAHGCRQRPHRDSSAGKEDRVRLPGGRPSRFEDQQVGELRPPPRTADGGQRSSRDPETRCRGITR